MKKLAILIMFVVCISASTNKLFAQTESMQDKLMKYKWIENNKHWSSAPGYSIYTKNECIYISDINDLEDTYIRTYYLSDDTNSKTFDYSKVNKSTNGRYLYRQVGKPRTNTEIYEILELNNKKFIIKIVYPDPRTMIGPPSIRHYKSKRLKKSTLFNNK